MADIAGLKAALEAAEAAKEKLVEERRSNRETMTRSEFRAYNESTRARQIDVERAVRDAQDELARALNTARQELYVGTVSESNTGGGTSNG